MSPRAPEITLLRAFIGPSIHMPQPGVLLRLRASSDYAAQLRENLKEAAQRVGIVLAQLRCESHQQQGEWQTELRFATPTPELGAEAARFAVAQLDTADRLEWDPDQTLWELQRRRRAEALPVAALQLLAEANVHNVPAFVRTDRALQLGYGARGIRIMIPARGSADTGVLEAHDIGVGGASGTPVEAALPDWSRLGAIPCILISGGDERREAALRIAQMLDAAVAPADATVEQVRELLADPELRSATIDLSPDLLAQQGLPLTTCAVSVALSLPSILPDGIRNRAELARTVGLPLLITLPDGIALLPADEPELLALAAYAPCRVILLSIHADNPAVARQRAAGGWASWLDGDAIYIGAGSDERRIGALDHQASPLVELAACAIQWALRQAPF